MGKIILATLMLGMLAITSLAQQIDAAGDMAFYQGQLKDQTHFHKRDYMFNQEESALIKYNPVSLTLGGLMYLYQNTLSQQLSASCLFEPSCSQYGKRAIRHYGIFKGIFLTADRITRCNKIAARDIHPLTINENSHRAKDPVILYE
jgi:putative membrane protein insertion efficiency factor